MARTNFDDRPSKSSTSWITLGRIKAELSPEHADTTAHMYANRRPLRPFSRLVRTGRPLLANGSMSSNQSGEGDIRRALIEADLVDCMVALPGQLFYSTQIPVCLWFVVKSKMGKNLRPRRRETLFIDARKMGTLIDRTHRELTDSELGKIVSTYHAWRGDKVAGKYQDEAGFCKGAATDEIAAHDYALTPGRYVGAVEVEDDGDPFEGKMPRLVAELHTQFEESARLEKAIKANLRGLGYGG